MRKLIWLTLLLGMGCGKIHFYGDTFYTVAGKITDSVNQPISSLNIKLLNTKSVASLSETGPSYNELLSATGVTDNNGNFKITFPGSDGAYNILLPSGYAVVDSVKKRAFNSDRVRIADSSFSQYFANIQTIKVVKL